MQIIQELLLPKNSHQMITYKSIIFYFIIMYKQLNWVVLSAHFHILGWIFEYLHFCCIIKDKLYSSY